MDIITRILGFVVGAICVLFGIGSFGYFVSDSMDRCYPSPAPFIGLCVGAGLLIVAGGGGAALLWVVFTAPAAVMR